MSEMNYNEWVTESDWSALKIGDRVLMANDDDAEVLITVTDRNATGYPGEPWITSENYVRYGACDWQLSVHAPPKVVLPTEPGIYSAPDTHPNALSSDWHTDGIKLYCLNTTGNWADVGWGRPHTSDAPLTRLAPVPVTAKKVLDRFASWWEFGPPPATAKELQDIAAEFGVTS